MIDQQVDDTYGQTRNVGNSVKSTHRTSRPTSGHSITQLDNMRLACIADQHGLLPQIPKCDVLVIAGDICPTVTRDNFYNYRWFTASFVPWIKGMLNKVVVVAGNHDEALEDHQYAQDIESAIQDAGGIYLKDHGVVIDGVKFWGTPWTPEFCGWGFMAYEDKLAGYFSAIPEGVDVLVSHGPARGHCDGKAGWLDASTGRPGEGLGSTALRDRIDALQTPPRLCISGHIHEAKRQDSDGRTEYRCVSIKSNHYKLAFDPTMIDIEPKHEDSNHSNP